MDITFYGVATQEVTGSRFPVRAAGRRILIDCGLIQGSPEHEQHNRAAFPFAPRDVDAVVLTHGHLDHSGGLLGSFRISGQTVAPYRRRSSGELPDRLPL